MAKIEYKEIYKNSGVDHVRVNDERTPIPESLLKMQNGGKIKSLEDRICKLEKDMGDLKDLCSQISEQLSQLEKSNTKDKIRLNNIEDDHRIYGGR